MLQNAQIKRWVMPRSDAADCLDQMLQNPRSYAAEVRSDVAEGLEQVMPKSDAAEGSDQMLQNVQIRCCRMPRSDTAEGPELML